MGMLRIFIVANSHWDKQNRASNRSTMKSAALARIPWYCSILRSGAAGPGSRKENQWTIRIDAFHLQHLFRKGLRFEQQSWIGSDFDLLFQSQIMQYPLCFILADSDFVDFAKRSDHELL